MAAITICSDFGAPKNKVWHCFHCFPIYFPWSAPKYSFWNKLQIKWESIWETSIVHTCKHICVLMHACVEILRDIQFSSVAQLCLTLCNPMDCSTPGFPVHHQLPELAQTPVYWVGDAIQPFHPLLSPSLPTFNLSQHQGPFQWLGSRHQVAKVLNFTFRIGPSNEYSELFSFRIDWLDRLAVLGTLKSLLQHHSSKSSILKP